MDLFNYSPIDLEGPTSRLLQLHGGIESSPICCTLFDAWLDPEIIIPYEALSYTWGGTDKTHLIGVNGRFLRITANLYLALKHLRVKGQDRIMWIDAVCINQDDVEERGHHVKQMAKIYKLAERVVIWLGPSATGSDLLMDCMKGLQRMSVDYACHDWKASDPRWQEMWSEVRPIDREVENKAVESLLKREWFKRVWVLQEVAFARVAVVVCGSLSVSARIFSLVLTRTEKVDSHCQAILDIMPGASRRDSWWTQNRGLRTLLIKFGQSSASDPRDMIYALLGMSSDANDTDLLGPDYNASAKTVVRRTISFLLRLERYDNAKVVLPAWNLFQFIRILPSLNEYILYWAMWSGHQKTIKALLKHNPVDLNARINYNLFPDQPVRFAPEYQRPIFWAAVDSSDEVLELFLQNDSLDVTVRDNKGNTILHLAAQHGRDNVVERLLKINDIDINSLNIKDMTALAIAATHKQHTVVRLLLERKDVDLNHGRTPLSLAIMNRDTSMVELLLRCNDVGVNVKFWNNETLLLPAKPHGSETYRTPLPNGTKYDTPLSFATKHVYTEIVRLLLQRDDLDTNVVNRSEKTSLHVAAERGYDDIVRLLLERVNIDVNSKDNFQNTPLSLAARNGGKEVVSLLLNRDDIDVNTGNKDNETPLFLAACNGNQEVVRLLLGHDNVDVNVRNIAGDTSLSIAAYAGHQDVVSLLLGRHDVDVNVSVS